MLLCVQHDVFFQHTSVQPKPKGLNTQISLKKRPFLFLPLLVWPYYGKRNGKKRSMGCLSESLEGVRLVQEDLDRLLLSTIGDRLHTATAVSDMVSNWPCSLLECLLFCAFYLSKSCMSYSHAPALFEYFSFQNALFQRFKM